MFEGRSGAAPVSPEGVDSAFLRPQGLETYRSNNACHTDLDPMITKAQFYRGRVQAWGQSEKVRVEVFLRANDLLVLTLCSDAQHYV